LIKEDYKKLPPISLEFIRPDRLKFLKEAKQVSFYNDSHITKDIVIERDFQKSAPTITDLNDIEIQDLKFNIIWNGEKLDIVFNTITDPDYIQKINKRSGREGRTIKLEKLENTFFLSDNNERDTIFPIKEVNAESITVYGFEKQPYEITGNTIMYFNKSF